MQIAANTNTTNKHTPTHTHTHTHTHNSYKDTLVEIEIQTERYTIDRKCRQVAALEASICCTRFVALND